MSSGLHAIFLAERPMLARLLTARLGADEAEDALQDLWLKLERGTGGPISDPAAYLYRMADNLALDRRRAAQRRIGRDSGWADMQAGAAELPNAERVLISRERLGEVEAMLAALPPRVAEAFRLYRFEELRQKQIAERMGISVSAVEKLLHRAYLRIHDHEPKDGVSALRRRLKGRKDHEIG